MKNSRCLSMVALLAIPAAGCEDNESGGGTPDVGGDMDGRGEPDAGGGADGGAPDANGANLSCEFMACGGDVTGTWSFEDVCMDGDLLTSCPDATFEADVTPTGTLEFLGDMTYEVSFMMQGTFKTTYPSSCFDPSTEDCSELEDEETTCTGDVSDSCVCTTDVDQTNEASGAWSVSGDQITMDEGFENTKDTGEFCVEEDVLKLQFAATGLDVTIVLSR